MNPEYVVNNFAISAVFVHDLEGVPIKDYEFSWERVLSFEGHTGIYTPFIEYFHSYILGSYLQFCHMLVYVVLNENVK